VIALAVLLGCASWTLLEYIIHRWMGHDRRFRRSPFGVEHLRHHVEGSYFAPSWKKAFAAAIVGAVLLVPATAIAGRALGTAYVAGLLACYAAYEALHRLEHTYAGFGAYGRWARRHHFHHHFVDGRRNHGVTSPIWDHVFGTYERPSTIDVPPKLVMAWLVDPATGEVRREHAATYRIAHKAAR
jgi:sterol desaturase/sphingolipid hydroxylase (fatty acid hydroxylase superfamily)